MSNPDDLFDYADSLLEVVGLISSQSKDAFDRYDMLVSCLVFFYFEQGPSEETDAAFADTLRDWTLRAIKRMRSFQNDSR